MGAALVKVYSTDEQRAQKDPNRSSGSGGNAGCWASLGLFGLLPAADANDGAYHLSLHAGLACPVNNLVSILPFDQCLGDHPGWPNGCCAAVLNPQICHDPLPR